MTQHLVIDLFTTGESKECGILKIAAVSFDPSEPIVESCRTYFAEDINIEDIDDRGYVFPTSFRDMLTESEDVELIAYLHRTGSSLQKVLVDFSNYLDTLSKISSGDIKLYVLDLYKAKILLHTLNKEFFIPATFMYYPSIFIADTVLEDFTYERFNILHNVNILGGKIYKFLRQKEKYS